MNYLIEQKLAFAKPRFTVRDESENEIFLVEGKALRLHEQLWVRDVRGNEVAFVEQQGSLRPRFDITRGGALVASMAPKRKMFKLNFVLTDAASGEETIARGNLSGRQYDFERQGRSVAGVRAKRGWTDRYALQVSETEDDVVYIAAVLVIDAFQAELKRRRARNS